MLHYESNGDFTAENAEITKINARYFLRSLCSLRLKIPGMVGLRLYGSSVSVVGFEMERVSAQL